MVKKRKKKKAKVSGYSVYDNTHVWHVDEGINYEISKPRGKLESGKYRKSICGVFFRPDRRNKTWKTCEKCVNDIAVDRFFKGSRTTKAVVPKTPKVPKRLIEQKFDPPEGIE